MFSVTVITTMTKRKGPGEERSYLAHITQPQSTIKGNRAGTQGRNLAAGLEAETT